jgi:hypothetical protein
MTVLGQIATGLSFPFVLLMMFSNQGMLIVSATVTMLRNSTASAMGS